MPRFLMAVLIASALMQPAGAKNILLPDGTPAMSAVLPDSWKPTATNVGMEATSANGDVYASVEYAKDYKSDLRAIMADNGRWMAKNKIVPDARESRDRDFTINGMTAHEVRYDAHDKDGATSVTFILVELPRDAIAVVTIWASAEEWTAHAKEISAIINSVRSINQ
jgi:hypothetical protein